MSQPPWPIDSSLPAGSRHTSSSLPGPGARKSNPLRSLLGSSSDAAEAAAAPRGTFPIIVFSHLGWDWVWQRPQQYLSRFAKRHPVLFVETYCSDVDATRVDLRTADGHPQVTIAQMHLPRAKWENGAWIDAERRRALQATLARDLAGRFDGALLWFYDPMAVEAFAGQLDECAIVYDCMDELSQFKGAPPALIAREEKLLGVADVVFCGGQKMRKKRLPLNDNCHFFGTGVDIQHFGTALSDDLEIAPEIKALGSGPVLGYFGVIDERIDYELLAKLADARADWHVVMVGPTAKVDPADFPRRPNLHFIGGRPYAQLPALTKGFSVALMPFALNAATEYINPTKALEYMAAGRPVVSTALDEVRLNFGNVAQIARHHQEFIKLCVREANAPSRVRIARGLKLAADNTWEANIARMEQHIADILVSAAPEKSTARTAKSPVPRLAYV
jgi:glycosyltransferase involved in cell wall biosynthesis